MVQNNVRLTIEDAQSWAEQRRGHCLSSEYVNNKTHMEWKCEKNHVWRVPFRHVKRGSWCPSCSATQRCEKRRKWSISRIQEEIAAPRGGTVLSRKYSRSSEKLEWKCGVGHVWTDSFSHVQSGRWCKTCNGIESFPERICRAMFEHFTGRQFLKQKPDWLLGLEVDGYCRELNVAFEYHGEQHYAFSPYFHENEIDFEKQKIRDLQKSKACKDRGILLFVVPFSISNDSVGAYVLSLLVEHKIGVVATNVPSLVEIGVFDSTRLDEMREIAINRGGLCLSNVYINARRNLLFECENLHRFESTPDNVKHGSWCKRCALSEENHPGAKLSRSDVEEIFRLCAKGLKRKEIARRFDIHVDHLYKILRGRVWKSVYPLYKRI